MKLLLHICCGPCATSSVSAWREKGAEVTGFFFNPNIHPFLEFRRRLTGARDLAGMVGLPLEEDLAYDPRSWFMQVGTAGDGRCRRCIAMRLERTAQVARDKGFAAFATTLAIS
ncbi:MAG: epoxyqueuosine reductase QueH, partial [Thermoleophilia bacterium]|nr:epoxyqueuosine reductase QueH [Thermoleophilia bacterium]